MKKIILFSLAAVFLFASCSKDKNTTTTRDTQNPSTRQAPNNNQTTQQTNSGMLSHEVKSVGSAEKKDEFVDFSWQENGKEMKLSDFKGKVILLNFWATWCGPCKRELPSLSQLSVDLKDKNFKLIGVSVDQDQGAVESYLSANNLSYTVLHEPSQLVGKYMQVTGQNQDVIPQTYIIDKNGKVVETIIGSREKDDFLKIINKYL